MSVEIGQTATFVEETELIRIIYLRIAVIIVDSLFVIPQSYQSVSLIDNGYRVLGVNGYGILTAGDGSTEVLVHILGVRQRVPVVFGVRVFV